MNDSAKRTTMLDFEPATETFRHEVISGLSADPRTLPCKYFYDERGSLLFDEICQLDEYYLTRSELAIMRKYAAEMADQIGPGVMLVEYGSGSSIKTRLLLEQLQDPVAYVPVDISRDHLHRSANRLSRAFGHIEILPVCADFTAEFDLPVSKRSPTHSAVYFPGSTIGNFQPGSARAMLAHIATLCGRGGGLLIGIDLQKDVKTIESAYNDSKGVTAEFNLNLLNRINRELDGEFDVELFEHEAIYNEEMGRVEISLVSQCEQQVNLGSESFELADGEKIRTEYSHKYTIDGFVAVAAEAGLELHRHWTDDRQLFAVLHLVVSD